MFEQYRKNRPKKQIAYQLAWAQDVDLQQIARISIARDGGEAYQVAAGLQRYLQGDTAHLFIARVGEEVAGFGKSRLFLGDEYAYEGWYLSGLIVKPEYRGCGLGRALTKRRIDELRGITPNIYYFVNSSNRVSIELHEGFGFKLLLEPFDFPRVEFTDGHGCLFALSTGSQ